MKTLMWKLRVKMALGRFSPSNIYMAWQIKLLGWKLRKEARKMCRKLSKMPALR